MNAPARKSALLGLLFLIFFAGFRTRAAADDLVGAYQCVGDAFGGRKYMGTVEISRKGDTYRLVWKLTSDETYHGIGILEGDVLAVSYAGRVTGVVAYKVQKDATLIGKWALAEGDGTLITEVLAKVVPPVPEKASRQ